MIKNNNEFMIIHKEDRKANGQKVYTASATTFEQEDNFIITFMSDSPLNIKLGERFTLDIKEIK